MSKVPANVITDRVPDELKPLVKALAADKRREAKERAQHERNMKRAAKSVRTGR